MKIKCIIIYFKIFMKCEESIFEYGWFNLRGNECFFFLIIYGFGYIFSIMVFIIYEDYL